MRTAAALSWMSGLGFGVPGIYAIWYLVDRGSIASLMGYPVYGDGVFENYGVSTSVTLLVAFLAVCVAECVAGWLMWGYSRSGAILALALLPFGLVFWIGFSLPFGPILAIARTTLILMSWSLWSSAGLSS